MGKRVEFKLPDIGEGVAEGEVTSWKVKPGDVLKEDQVMVEVMTDKATVEIGSPVNGTVLEIRVAEGQAVPVGAIIIVLEEGAGAAAAPAAAPKPAASHAAPAAGARPAPAAAKPMQPARSAPQPAPAAHAPGQPAHPSRSPGVEQQTAAAAAGAVNPPKSPAPAAQPAHGAPAAHAAPKSAGGREEINFALPDIGEGVAEGEVTRWMVKPGDTVKEDQPIVEVMTDKATVEIGSPVDGEVLQLLVKAGETVPVGAILLVLGAAAGAGKHVPVPHGGHAAAAAPKAASVGAASGQPATAELHIEDDAGELVGAGVASAAVALADSGLPARGDGSRRVRAAPATRRFAREAGVDVAALNGSGPEGRILMDDVRAAMAGARRLPAARAPAAAPGAAPAAARPSAPAPAAAHAGASRGATTSAAPTTPSRPAANVAAAASAAAPAAARAPAAASAAAATPSAPLAAPRPHALSGDERVPLRGLRKRIAAQMRLSKQTAAHFTYVEEIDVSELVKLRNAAKARAASAGVKLTYMPFIIKAVCVALRDFPLLNASLDEAAGELVMHHDLNLGIAVDTPNGLIVPVVRNADRKSMTDLAREMTELADRARAGKTAPADVGGGTFTITNAGNIGGLLATPIINVPEVAIMGVHAIRRRPWVVDEEIVIRDIMLLSLSLDHRVVDGAVGAYFMNRVKELLENPGLMLFEPA